MWKSKAIVETIRQNETRKKQKAHTTQKEKHTAKNAKQKGKPELVVLKCQVTQ